METRRENPFKKFGVEVRRNGTRCRGDQGEERIFSVLLILLVD